MTSIDPDLDTLLSDPLIRSVMKADRVDPERLRVKLAGIGAALARRRQNRRESRPVRDCTQARFAAGHKSSKAAPAGGIW